MANPTWREMKEYIESRIGQLRRLNDRPSLDSEATALVRGGLAELKQVIKHYEPPPPPATDDDRPPETLDELLADYAKRQNETL